MTVIFGVISLIVVIAGGLALLGIPGSIGFIAWWAAVRARNPARAADAGFYIRNGVLVLINSICIVAIAVVFMQTFWWRGP